MITAFERFYRIPAMICTIERDDYDGTYTKTELSSVMADIQPYSGGLAEKEYGFDTEVTARMFCGDCADIVPGRYVIANGRLYLIRYTARWGLGLEALLDEDTSRRYTGNG